MTSQSTITQQGKGYALQTQPTNGVLAQDTATVENFPYSLPEIRNWKWGLAKVGEPFAN